MLQDLRSFRELPVLNDHLDERTGEELKRRYTDHGGVTARFDFAPAEA